MKRSKISARLKLSSPFETGALVKKASTIIEDSLFPSFKIEGLHFPEKPSIVTRRHPDLTFKDAKTDYLTHNFHSYPAKFIPQLTAWLMKNFSKEGSIVLDPFAGCGTTLVEAILNNRNSLGVEINPIGRLACKVKTTVIKPDILHTHINKLYSRIVAKMPITGSKVDWLFKEHIKESHEGNDLWMPRYMENFEKWFLPSVALALAIIRSEIMKIERSDIHELCLLAFSSIIKTVSNARTEERIPKLRKTPRQEPDTLFVYKSKLDRMVKDLLEFDRAVKGVKVHAKITGNDARMLPITENSVDLVVTSPPYANAIDYVRLHKLSLYWLGEKDLSILDRSFIGTERVYAEAFNKEFRYRLPSVNKYISQLKSIDKKRGYILYRYFSDMEQCFKEMYRVLEHGSVAAIVIGNSTIRSVKIPTNECFNSIAKSVGFKIRKPLVRAIPKQTKGLAHVHSEYGGEMVECEYINIIQKP